MSPIGRVRDQSNTALPAHSTSSPIRKLRCLVVLALALALVLLLRVVPAVAQTPPAPLDLTNTSIEDLLQMRVQRVFGASERLQPVTEAPSSVTIVTAQEIARYGYRTLADVLRSVRGFYVSNDRNYSYVGVRGFARPGDYNTRILLLVNSHRVNDNVYDQAPIGADLGIDVAMFDRVEIIRGPASSLYGTSAFFAVVNIITRTGSQLGGVSVDLDGGTLATAMARISAGRKLANDVDLVVSGSMEQSAGDTGLYFREFDTIATNSGVADHLDDERISSIYGRLTAGHFALTAAFGRRLKDVPTASFGTIFNEQAERERTTDRHTSIIGQYGRTVRGTQVAFDGGFDRFDYEGMYPYASENPDYRVLADRDGSKGIRWTASVRLARQLARNQTLTGGAEYYDNVRQDQWSLYSDPTVPSFDMRNSSHQAGVYVQDEIRVRRWLLLNGGVRYDQYEQFGRATPRGAIIASPTPSTAFKYLYGEAFRAPNAYELFYYGTTPPGLRPEFVRTHEVVWEQYVGEWLRTSVSAYHYAASDLITFQSLESDTLTGRFGFANEGVIKASGLELEAEVRTKRDLQVLTSYVVQDARRQDVNVPLTNSPRHMVKARVQVPVRLRAFVSAEWQLVGERSTLAGATVAPSSVVHLTAAIPVSRSLTLTGSIRNLFDRAYFDPGSDEHLPDAIPQTARTARVGLRWTVGGR